MVRTRAGFTLIELLVVMGILAISFGLIAFLPREDRRDAAVQAAAQELAATIRFARALAIDKRCCIGLAFNVENGLGTSGRQLNNWGGQHWYRIIGPSFTGYMPTDDGKKTYGYPGYPTPSDGAGFFAPFLRKVDGAWIGDRHPLRAKAVRFVAVSDQDNGTCPNLAPSYAATYPRPWFGWWDAASRRLYPWGGYDSAIPGSGFHFQGSDGALAGCLNPADRSTTDPSPARVFTQGRVRPLINGQWLDYVLRFNPDGTVEEPTPMPARYMSSNGMTGNKANIADLLQGAIGESRPLTSWVRYSGFWSITLGPDIQRDDDSFTSAQDVLRALMPLYRVQVSPLGAVRVVKVQNSPPRGTGITMDAQITDWQSASQTQTCYQGQVPTDPDGNRRGTSVPPGLPRVVPASDFVLTQMLSSRQWWMTVTP